MAAAAFPHLTIERLGRGVQRRRSGRAGVQRLAVEEWGRTWFLKNMHWDYRQRVAILMGGLRRTQPTSPPSSSSASARSPPGGRLPRMTPEGVEIQTLELGGLVGVVKKKFLGVYTGPSTPFPPRPPLFRLTGITVVPLRATPSLVACGAGRACACHTPNCGANHSEFTFSSQEHLSSSSTVFKPKTLSSHRLACSFRCLNHWNGLLLRKWS